MAIKNWVRSFWMPDGSSPKFEKVVKSVRYAPQNQTIMIFDIASGFGKWLKRIPMRLTRQQYIDATHVSLMPCGNVEGVKNPDMIKFICTARHVCHTKLLEEISQLDNQNNLRGEALVSLKEKFDKIMEKVKISESTNPILVAHSEIEKEFAKAGVK